MSRPGFAGAAGLFARLLDVPQFSQGEDPLSATLELVENIVGRMLRAPPNRGSPDAEPGVAQQGVEQWSCSSGCGTRSQGGLPLEWFAERTQQTTSST
jgi:hypothetical protein